MSDIPPIKLPSFAAGRLSQHECPTCRHTFNTTDVIGVGFHRDSVNLHFAVDARCKGCGTEDRLIFPDFNVVPDKWGMCAAVMCDDVPPDAPRIPNRFLTPMKPNLGLNLLLGARRSGVLKLFGGYQTSLGMPKLLLFRWHHPHSEHRDGILRIETRLRVRIAQLPDNEVLRPDEWEQFLALPEGGDFYRRGQGWRKMTKIEVEALVRDRVYRIADLLKGKPRGP